MSASPSDPPLSLEVEHTHTRGVQSNKSTQKQKFRKKAVVKCDWEETAREREEKPKSGQQVTAQGRAAKPTLSRERQRKVMSRRASSETLSSLEAWVCVLALPLLVLDHNHR